MKSGPEVCDAIVVGSGASSGWIAKELALSPAHRLLAEPFSGAAHLRDLESIDAQRIWREGLASLRDGDL